MPPIRRLTGADRHVRFINQERQEAGRECKGRDPGNGAESTSEIGRKTRGGNDSDFRSNRQQRPDMDTVRS